VALKSFTNKLYFIIRNLISAFLLQQRWTGTNQDIVSYNGVCELVIVRQEICDCGKRTVVQIRVISAWLTDYSNINFRVTYHFIRVLIGLKNIDRNFCSVHEEITSIRLYTPGTPRSGLHKGVYNLIEVISNEPNK
jgi:hypothetical protein